MPEPRLSEFAPAKVNLYLHVTGRRADGYHLLDSLAVFCPVGDWLHATPAETLSLTVEGPFGAALAGRADNLVLRAARALAGILGGMPGGIQDGGRGGARHRHQDKRMAREDPPPPLEGGGRGEGSVPGSRRSFLRLGTPPPNPLPQGEGENVAQPRAYPDAYGGARIVLEKHLPVASGIGGGSADAAAALRLLCRLWGFSPAAALTASTAAPVPAAPGPASPPIARAPTTPVSIAPAPMDLSPIALTSIALTSIALSLGADVPVCLASRPARMGGVGETLSPAPALPPAGIVLVNPGVALATASVFRARTGELSAPAALPASWADAAAMAGDLAMLRNDLQPPAIALCPAIGAVLAALEAVPGCLLARLSGSGATCFGLFPDAAAAAAAAGALARPGWWCWGGALAAP